MMMMWEIPFIIIIIIREISWGYLITCKYILFIVVLISLLTCFDLLLCFKEPLPSFPSYDSSLVCPTLLARPHAHWRPYSYLLFFYHYWHVLIVYSGTLDMVQFKDAIYIDLLITGIMFAILAFREGKISWNLSFILYNAISIMLVLLLYCFFSRKCL